MAQDHLEQFIKENREAFDDAFPGLKVWAGIDKVLEEKRTRRRIRLQSWAIAASVLILLFAGAAGGSYWTQHRAQDTAVILEKAAPEFKELEQYYSGQIEVKMTELALYPQQKLVVEDLAQLDRIMEELKAELLEAPEGGEEQIIQNLIRSYQTKIEILERVLERIPSTNKHELKPEENEISI